MNEILLGPCDACLMANFSVPTLWCWSDDRHGLFRLLTGGGQVKKGQISKMIFKGHLFDAAHHGDPMLPLVLFYVVNNGTK